MMIAIDEEEWKIFRDMEFSVFLFLLKQLARKVRLSEYKKPYCQKEEMVIATLKGLAAQLEVGQENSLFF